MSTCQLCCNKLDINLYPEDWKMYEKWNLTLSHNDIPLKLQPGMFVCKTCQSYISDDSFSTVNMEYLLRNLERRYYFKIVLHDCVFIFYYLY